MTQIGTNFIGDVDLVNADYPTSTGSVLERIEMAYFIFYCFVLSESLSGTESQNWSGAKVL